jgi:hypothetical protein
LQQQRLGLLLVGLRRGFDECDRAREHPAVAFRK